MMRNIYDGLHVIWLFCFDCKLLDISVFTNLLVFLSQCAVLINIFFSKWLQD